MFYCKSVNQHDQPLPQHQSSITDGLCKHHTMLEVANPIAVVGGDTAAPRGTSEGQMSEVWRQR